MGKGQDLYVKARTLIPGGTQLLTKRPERFLPQEWPSYYSKAKGAHIWDLDGKQYLDMTISGVGACVLGYADDDVERDVIAAVQSGSMTTLNAPEEVELAELMCELHPWADMARFCRTGAEATAVAVRIARALTGRDKIAFCGYHGWQDWYIAANLSADSALDGHLLPGLDPAGVPRGLAGTMIPFNYNNLDEVEAIFAEHGDDLAAIIMEPARSRGPAPGFLKGIREITQKNGSVLIFDEVTSAWRVNTGGIHLTYGLHPDIAVFSKAISNGYPMSAVIGTEAVMQAAQSTFISSTNWTEKIGPVAALATIKKHRRLEVGAHLVEIGQRVQDGWKAAGERTGLKVETNGITPLSQFSFKYDNEPAVATLFTQLMLDRDILASFSFYPSLAHTVALVDQYLEQLEEVFTICVDTIERGEVESSLRGGVRHPDFRRLT